MFLWKPGTDKLLHSDFNEARGFSNPMPRVLHSLGRVLSPVLFMAEVSFTMEAGLHASGKVPRAEPVVPLTSTQQYPLFKV